MIDQFADSKPAFDRAVVSDPPFEAVIHTASPYHFHAKDAQELLAPAILGTTGILKSVRKHAPLVTRVVITSSFAAINDVFNSSPEKIYSEVCVFHQAQSRRGSNKEDDSTQADWSPITEEQANDSAANAYRASKTFAVGFPTFDEKGKSQARTLTTHPRNELHGNLSRMQSRTSPSLSSIRLWS